MELETPSPAPKSPLCAVDMPASCHPEFLARLCGRLIAAEPAADLNLAPTDDAPVVRLDRETGTRHLDVLKWGVIPYFTNDVKTARHPINARSDTVARSNMFKAAFAKRRCLVPAAGYFTNGATTLKAKRHSQHRNLPKAASAALRQRKVGRKSPWRNVVKSSTDRRFFALR